MKSIIKWIAGIVGSVLTLVMSVTLLPYATALAGNLLPDISGAYIKSAAILSEQLEASARLETLRVTGDGTVSLTREAAFIGVVSETNAHYDYVAAFGVDLSQVQIRLSGNRLTFVLPQPEVLSFVPTLQEVKSGGTLDRAVKFDEIDLQKALNEEGQALCETYLTGENAQALRDSSVKAFEDTIAVWLSQVNSRLSYGWEWAEAE